MPDFARPPRPRGCALGLTAPARRQWLRCLAGASSLGLFGLGLSTAARARPTPAATGLSALPSANPASATPTNAAPPAAPPLSAVLADLLATSGLPLSAFGLHVQAVDADATPLASLNAEMPYQLASTAKLVTTMAALDLLGPQYRWRTSAFLSGPLQDGRLMGDLVIVGGGNALLRADELRAWFVQLRAKGLHEVMGNIVLDRHAFRLHDKDFAQSPLPTLERPHHVWPDAFTLDEGRLQLMVDAGPDGRSRVQMQPVLDGVQVDSQLRGGAGDCGLSARWQDPSPDGSTPALLTLQGHWRPTCGQRKLQVAPLPHEAFTSRAVLGLWREAGGLLQGQVLDRPPPAEPRVPARSPGPARRAQRRSVPQPWAVHLSAPLTKLVRDINKASDNLGARNLLLSLARGFPQRPATMGEARDRLGAWLRKQGLADDDIQVDSGSGLSRAERGKPRALVQLLRQGWAAPQGQALLASLPVAGVDGTLIHRMAQGRATGRAFLKTGSLADTRALAGYVQAASGTTYAVAVLVNHADATRATPALDRVIEWLAARA